MSRERELDRGAIGGDLGGGILPAETHPGGNRRITLREIADKYFPEDAEQMHQKLLLFYQFLRPSGISFNMSADNIIPLIFDKLTSLSTGIPPESFSSLDTKTGGYNLLMKMNQPKFTLFVSDQPERLKNIHTTVVSEITKGLLNHDLDPDDGHFKVKETKPEDIGLPREGRRVFQMTREVDAMEVHPLGDASGKTHRKQPYIIIEESEDLFVAGKNPMDHPSFSLRLAVDTNDEDKKVHDFSPLRTLFEIEIKIGMYSDSISNYDSHGDAQVIFEDSEEPYALISDKSLAKLREPIDIFFEYRLSETLRKTWETDLFFQHFLRTGDRSQIKERRVRPFFYLDLLKIAARMVYFSIATGEKYLAGEIPTRLSIFPETSQPIFEHLVNRLDFLVSEEFIRERRNFYTPIEYLMLELLWQGENIWPSLDEFNFEMAKAARLDPSLCWKTMQTLGLNKVLPAFRNMSKNDTYLLRIELLNLNKEFPQLDGLSKFCIAFDRTVKDDSPFKRKQSEDVLGYWTRIMAPLPDNSFKYDHRPGKEFAQSNRYFMELALAKAMHNAEIGQMPIAACLTNKGKAIITLGNEGDLLEGHAETRVIKRVLELYKGKVSDLEDSSLYSTLGPCSGCITTIRQNAPWIRNVIYGLATKWKIRELMYERQNTIVGPIPRYKTPPVDSFFSRRLQHFYRSLEKHGRFLNLLPLKLYPDFDVLDLYLKHIQSTTPLYYYPED